MGLREPPPLTQCFLRLGGDTFWGDSKRVRNRLCTNHALLGGGGGGGVSGGMPPQKLLAALRLNLVGLAASRLPNTCV